MRFPFELNADKYLRNLWNKQTYLYLAEFFRTAKFDPNMAAVADQSIDDYRYAGGTSADISASDWRLPGAGGTGSAYAYTSFFKVWATTVGSSVTIGVKDGSPVATLPDGKCGEVRVNNDEIYVSAYSEEFVGQPGNYAAYLICWQDELLGAGAEVVIRTGLTEKPAAPTRVDPAPTHIVSHGFLYLGRVYVDEAYNCTVNQDYLQGGTAQIVMLGPCGGDVALYLQQGGE